MSRFELGGKGEPIPLIALPDPNLDATLPPQVLVLQDGVPFVKTDWVGLGYTHYEVWCIGASGGKGGDGGGRMGIGVTGTGPTEELGVSWQAYFTGSSPMVTHLHDPFIQLSSVSLAGRAVWGGGGGGGGLHVVSGLLAALPEAAPVVVGQAGADAPIGQLSQNNPMHATTPYYPPGAMVLDNNPLFYPPQPGGDGGASSFNGETCRASGGKGGGPGAYWAGTTLMISGDGGEGGVGGQTAAGGGAVGSTTLENGSDGTWDGTIGKGGGGGRGGAVTPHEEGPMGSV